MQLREADEEVGLPLNFPHVHLLRTMPPFPSLYKLIVTPVIALLSDTSILQSLVANPSEVDEIFDHPLEASLSVLNHAEFDGCGRVNTNQGVFRSYDHALGSQALTTEKRKLVL